MTSRDTQPVPTGGFAYDPTPAPTAPGADQGWVVPAGNPGSGAPGRPHAVIREEIRPDAYYPPEIYLRRGHQESSI